MQPFQAQTHKQLKIRYKRESSFKKFLLRTTIGVDRFEKKQGFDQIRETQETVNFSTEKQKQRTLPKINKSISFYGKNTKYENLTKSNFCSTSDLARKIFLEQVFGNFSGWYFGLGFADPCVKLQNPANYR
jgi:hypothetical protein